MRKLSSQRGETLIETLTALLVATVALLFLSTAIVSATRVNDRVRKIDTAFAYTEDRTTSSGQETVTITDSDGKSCTINTKRYSYSPEEDDSFVYQYYERVG